MIGLLIALYPRSWRTRYGREFRALLEASPVTLAVIGDVMLHAARQHTRAHSLAARVGAALVVSVIAEVIAVHAHMTDNILWSPNSPTRTILLAAVLLPWLPVAGELARSRRHRTPRASSAE